MAVTLGSMANQKYEISKLIQRHLQIVHHSSPSPETIKWKEGIPAKPIGSNIAKERLHSAEINERNEYLSNRLFTIMNENREARSTEYAPGWRTGLGMPISLSYRVYIIK